MLLAEEDVSVGHHGGGGEDNSASDGDGGREGRTEGRKERERETQRERERQTDRQTERRPFSESFPAPTEFQARSPHPGLVLCCIWQAVVPKRR